MTAGIPTTELEVQREMLTLAEDWGWDVMSRPEMNALRGKARMNEVIVESLLIDAIRNLNVWIDNEAARQVAAYVRRINSAREMLKVLRNGVAYKPAPDEPTRDVMVLDSVDPSRNRCVVTEEVSIRTGGTREPRLDVVFFVNGLPLGAIENKDTGQLLSDAVDDWRGYWRDAPQLIAQIAVVGCCNGLQCIVGPSGLNDITGYMEWPDPWPHTVDDPDDQMQTALAGAFHPHTLVDLAVNFTVFETREGITTKKLARAHQYRASNKLIQRVVEGKLNRGIVWHATGSGKSLTMVFAGRKLLRIGLGNPLVLIVVDRTELDEQINETLTACEFDGLERAKSRKHLEDLLGARTGGVIVTTVQKFDRSMSRLLQRREVICFIDEAHRTQFGRFGIWMRDALPSAALFGFTGTPIETYDRSTRAKFSPRLDGGNHERYLDRYGFDQAIADGATVKLIYEPRLPEWQLTATDIDERLEELTPDMSDDERDRLRQQAARQSVIAKAPARVTAVVEDIVKRLDDRVTPRGLVGQAVLLDREACALMARELAKHLGPEEFAVIMSRSKSDSGTREGDIDVRQWYPAAQWERVHGRPPHAENGDDEQETEEGFVASTDRAAIKDFIARFKREDDPLRLLIVNKMLLTGFDAPNEGALFLDAGLSGHTLMQAINRPNRRYYDKDAGVIFDYWGLLKHLNEALATFAAEDLAGLVEGSERLVERFPVVLDEALAVVDGAPPGSPRRRMLWLIRKLTDDPDAAERFESSVREAQSIFEVLAPDPRLARNLDRYTTLLEMWTAWIRGTRRDQRGDDELRHKTRKLVQETIGLERIREDLPAATIDVDFLKALSDATAEELTADEKATEIEAAIIHEIKVRREDDPLAKTLAERFARLRAKQYTQTQMTLDALAEWEELVHKHIQEQESAEELGLTPAGGVALTVLRRAGTGTEDTVLQDVAGAIGAAFDEVAAFEEWSDRPDVIQALRKAAVRELAGRKQTRRLALLPELLDELLAGLATLQRGAR